MDEASVALRPAMVATIIISKQEGLQKVEWKASVWATLCGGGGRFL